MDQFIEQDSLKNALPWMEYQPSWNILDASKTQRFMECPRAYFYEYVLGWRSDRPNNHLIFGESWHQALEHLLIHGYSEKYVMEAYDVFLKEYRKTFPMDTDDAFAPKTPYNAAKALGMYVKNYRGDAYDVIYTEIGGQVSISDNYSLTFRMDGLCYDPSKKCYFVLEHKTCSSIARQWSDQWALSFQVGTYTHALHCMFPDTDVTGVVVNGTCFQKRDIKFMRIPVYKSLANMNAWLSDALYWAGSIHKEFAVLKHCRDSENVLLAFPRNPTACTKYFGCPFHDFCCTWSNPLQRAYEVPMGMIEEHWNPLDRELREKVELQLPSEGV